MKIHRVKEIMFLAEIVAVLTYDDLSIRKIAIQSTTWSGTYDLYKAVNAVDRNITTCMRTDIIGLTSPYRTVWWKVDLGGVYNIYSVNILFKNYNGYENRQRGRFAGFSLYVSNTGDMDGSSLCYMDGPQLPPLNFTTICTLSGRYVIFYNERLHGVIYPEGYELGILLTELCEVIVKGCGKPGVYSSNCDVPCPINCKHNTCHIQNGTCFECKPGWTRTTCTTKCAIGLYGRDCKEQCSGHCRDDAPCNHVTGQCDGGCVAGWRNSYCANVCENGTYGYDCVNNCSGHCLNDSPCNKQIGHCPGGCKPGYTNNFCSEKCPSGYYGNECRNKCSGHCLNKEDCDHVDGICTSGCQYGYIGQWCNRTCNDGYYGPNCSHACSPNCRICNPTDGTCSCFAGWKGPNCNIACIKSYGENCQYPCNPICVNQTCDPFNGTCLSECENGTYEEKCNLVIPNITTPTLGNSSMNEKEDMLTVGLAISLSLNAVFIIAALYVLWRRYIKIHPVAALSCWKSPIYEKSEDVTGQEQTYQELSVQDNTYQYIT